MVERKPEQSIISQIGLESSKISSGVVDKGVHC